MESLHILRWPILKSVKAVWGSLGLTGYYHRLIGTYDDLACPLTNLLKKESLLKPMAQRAFQTLKEGNNLISILWYMRCLILISSNEVGAVLSQWNWRIAYFTKVISDKSATRSAYERDSGFLYWLYNTEHTNDTTKIVSNNRSFLRKWHKRIKRGWITKKYQREI